VELRHGTVESNTGSRVAYASYGRDDAPAVLVLGGISAHRFVAGGPDGTQGWWPGVVGSGTALDPERHRLVSMDYLGGAGDSTLGEPVGPGLPVVTTADQAFQIISQSLDLHRIAPECIRVPTTVVSVDSDGLVPPWLVAEMARRLPDSGRTVRIASNYGHDAFLKEKRVVSRLVRRFLTGEVHHG
jgi:homoserine O-acetyltransferase